MNRKKPGYRAYLLRFWCTEQAGVRIWRASLEPPGTDERLGFPSLDELFSFIREQTIYSGIESGDELGIDQGGDGMKP